MFSDAPFDAPGHSDVKDMRAARYDVGAITAFAHEVEGKRRPGCCPDAEGNGQKGTAGPSLRSG